MRTTSAQARRRRSGFLRDGSRLRFLILATLLLGCALCGGSYRPTIGALVLLRPLLVVGLGALILVPGPWDWRGLRVPALLLLLFAATMAVQLIPLPAGWWAAMPGHARYTGTVALAPDAARPISLVPDLTINSLLALLPAAAMLVGFAGMREGDRWNTLWLVLALGLGSAGIGLVQAGGGNGLPTLAGRSDDVVTGLLANRNHGAVLLAAMLPLIAVALRVRDLRPLTRWLALAAGAAVILPLILLSGSRQGMVLGAAAMLVAAALVHERGRGDRRLGRRGWLVAAGIGGAILVTLVAVVVSGRALSVDRFGGLADPGNEARVRSFPILLRMTRDFLPFGIGYGAFDPVYRGYEPDAFLHSSYFNRAHNDLLETVMSGGLAALVPILGLLGWLGLRLRDVLRRGTDRPELARAGAAVIALMLLASLVDYPLRTAIMSSVFALACCWLATAPRPPALPGTHLPARMRRDGAR